MPETLVLYAVPEKRTRFKTRRASIRTHGHGNGARPCFRAQGAWTCAYIAPHAHNARKARLVRIMTARACALRAYELNAPHFLRMRRMLRRTDGRPIRATRCQFVMSPQTNVRRAFFRGHGGIDKGVHRAERLVTIMCNSMCAALASPGADAFEALAQATR